MLRRLRFVTLFGKVFATCSRGIRHGGKFFSVRARNLKERDVLVLDAVMDSGVMQEFLLRRLGESQPRSLRLALLLDKPPRRRVALEPDYFAFQTASNQTWVGYGLADATGRHRNERSFSVAGKPTGSKPVAERRLAASNKKKRRQS
jgi:hypothetical protein